ncbi:MAG: alpha/beta fold hydrolase [Desulfomonilaceae bacterium]|nr:alpha/beta hydrolase [Syntrophaceae bacterium]
MPTISVRDRRISYESQPKALNPDKLAIIFIHGTGGDSNDWRYQLEGLCSQFQVVAIELPGHGGSDGPGESEVAKYTDWVQDFVEEMRLVKVFLVGCSLGSAIALNAALNPRHWLKAIGLVGAGARLRVIPELLDALINNPEPALDQLGGYCLSDNPPESLLSLIKQKYSASNPVLIHGDLSACDKFDIMEKVSSIKLPTSIIVGAQDKLTPVKYSVYLNKALENSTLTVIENAGHLVMLEQPENFNLSIGRFLEDIGCSS